MGTRQKPAWEDRFINLLGSSCNVTLAARGANISRKTAYQYKKQSAEFAQRWREAQAEAVELLEAEAWARARKQSDTLMVFLLKAYKPDKYQDRSKIIHEFDAKQLALLKELKRLADLNSVSTGDLFEKMIQRLAAQDAHRTSDS